MDERASEQIVKRLDRILRRVDLIENELVVIRREGLETKRSIEERLDRVEREIVALAPTPVAAGAD